MRGRPGEDGCGGIIDDVTVYKFHAEHYMVVASSGPRKASAQWIADHAIGTSASRGTWLSRDTRDERYRDLEPWVSTVADEDDDAIRPFW